LQEQTAIVTGAGRGPGRSETGAFRCAILAQRHFCIPPLERFKLDEVLALIGHMRYFVLHAPRQTGKTSILLSLRDLLNNGAASDYRCVYVNVEAAARLQTLVPDAVLVGGTAPAHHAHHRVSLDDDHLRPSP